MHRPQQGPTRSTSVQSYLRQTRALAVVAGLAFVAGIVSDGVAPDFWNHHSLLAGLASNVIVVMLTVAVVNEAIQWRNRQRWSVLAQYVMLALVRHARMVWMGIAELAGILPTDADAGTLIDAGAEAVRDTPRLAESVRGLVADRSRRRQLQDLIARLAEHSDDVLGRWAGVMLNAAAYAELIDRHVELASGLAWLQGLLDAFEPPEDRTRQRRARAHPAGQLEGQLDDEVLAQRLVAITQLAERLDRATLQIAGQLVPREWWTSRYATPDTGSGSDDASAFPGR